MIREKRGRRGEADGRNWEKNYVYTIHQKSNYYIA